MNMFAKDRFDLDVGLVEVSLDGELETTWADFLGQSDFSELLEEREAYIKRHFILGSQKKGILVTIHGLNTYAEWNYDLAPIISSNNWIFAPFSYGKVTSALISNNRKKEIAEKFRDWINRLYDKYGICPSIFAHSFGTYILGEYITGFNYNPPIKFKNIVLAGSILTPEFDWISCFDNGCVSSVFNIVSPNDPWVQYMDTIKWLNNNKLYGTAGTEGFSQAHPRLLSESINIYDHNNMLKQDIFEKKMLPYLNLARSLENFNYLQYITEESMQDIINELKK